MPIIALRGATTAAENTESAILAATRELLSALAGLNRIDPPEIISAFFTVTADLDAAFPARAARELGWNNTALLDLAQAPVQGDLPRCIRVLVHLDRDSSFPLRPVYLGEAQVLRPDLPAADEASTR